MTLSADLSAVTSNSISFPSDHQALHLSQTLRKSFATPPPFDASKSKLASVPSNMASKGAAASPKTALSKANLCTLLGIDNQNALQKWFESSVFKAHMEEFLVNCWTPKQVEKAKGGKARQGPALNAVRNAIRRGEAAGQRKYSARYPNKRDWNDLDHYARFICVAVEDNREMQGGVFFDKNIDEGEAEEMMWKSLHSYLDIHRKKSSSAKSTTTITPRATQKATFPNQLTDRPPAANNPTTNIPVPSENDKQSDAPKNRRKRKNRRSTDDISNRDDAQQPASIPVASENDQPDSPKKRRKRKRRSTRASVSDSGGSNRNRDTSGGLGQASPAPDSEPQQVEEGKDDQDEPEMSPLDVLKLEAKGKPFNLIHDWHKHQTIRKVLESFDPAKAEMVADNTLTDERLNYLNAESQTWEKTIAAMDKEAPDDDASKPRNTNKRDVPTKPIVQLPIATENDLQQHAEQEALFANAELEGGDYEEACTFLGIKNPEKPWMNGMLPGQQLQAWQVIGIKFIFDCIMKGLRGCVIADIVGLGKTWEVAGYLLAVSKMQESGLFQH